MWDEDPHGKQAAQSAAFAAFSLFVAGTVVGFVVGCSIQWLLLGAGVVFACVVLARRQRQQ